MPIRHFTVTGIFTARFIAATHRCDELRLGHQAGAKAAVFHAIRRAADVEIDLVIAETLADARGFRELARIGAAELQRDRMLAGVEAEQPRAIAMNDRGVVSISV